MGQEGDRILFLIEQLEILLKSIKNAQENIKSVASFKNLEKQEILDLQEKDGKVMVYLKNKNHPKIVEY